VVAAAFGKEAEARLVRNLRASPVYRPELALVAVDQGEIVGHVMLSDVDLRGGDTVRRALSLAPLAVAPSRQRSGIGSALVREATDRADALGEALVVLEGSPVYYARFGFRDARQLGIEFELPDWAPPEAGQALPLSAYDPAWRGKVVYSSAFQGLEDA
jgi:putative acetyltransferase